MKSAIYVPNTQKRWTTSAQDILDHEVNLTGDIFLSAAFVSYLGAFTGPFRLSLSKSWTVTLRDKGVRVSEGYSLSQVREPNGVRDEPCGDLRMNMTWSV